MNFELFLIPIVILGFGTVIYFLTRRPKADQGQQVLMEWLKEMRGSSETMQKRIDETNKTISDRLDNAARFIGALQKELGGFAQIGPDIRKLSEVLASPKARGNFGEEILEELLRQALPRSAYEFQHKFRSGEVVDAMVRVGDHILPIDSKFSLENFRLYKEAKTDEAAEGLKKAFLKDIKKRVDEIQKKYILPQEGTFDFALMYIPSEGLYSEVSQDTGIVSYSREKKVFFVSPQNLYLHLQVVLLGLRREQISEKAGQILAMITGIKQESEKFGRNLDVLATHVKNSGNTMGTVLNDYAKLKTVISNAANLQIDTPGGGRTGDKLLEE
ncbi:MAG: hypothetical protein UY65_C0005G0016 [Parcubacteria group bacterium GW2011_GWA2_51_12]|nr:MAG: hypothetical protein UY65_C0005G0016 [Parcubacteria group bacterium GW2011_GWA2_51_12]